VDAGDRLWKVVYVILCLALLVLIAWQFSLYAADKMGWDYQTYVSAIQAFNHGQNPYILENLVPYQGGTQILFDYPPHTLYFFLFLDFFQVFHSINIYYLVLIVLLIISAYLIMHLDKNHHYLFLITLLLTGFDSLMWNFLTGNSPILFLFLFAVIFTLWVKGKYWQSSVIMGLSAAFSLFTAPFVALYLIARRPIKDRLALISLSIGVVALFFVVDYVVNPSLLIAYITRMQAGTSLYRGGMNEPTPFLMFKDALSGVSAGSLIPVILVSCAYIGLVLYATWGYYRKNRGNSLKILSLVMLAIFMILPYLAPYDFILLVIPLYLLFKDCSYPVKSLVLVVLSLPFFVWYSQFFGILEPTQVPYVQAYSLILIFIVAILQDHLAPVSDKAIKGRGG